MNQNNEYSTKEYKLQVERCKSQMQRLFPQVGDFYPIFKNYYPEINRIRFNNVVRYGRVDQEVADKLDKLVFETLPNE